MMGAGKSTIGKELAKKMCYDFVDCDELIEQSTSKSIMQIFATDGEKYFRAIEEDILTRISYQKKLVVATGGGCVLSEKNRESMASTGLRIFLEVDIDIIYSRLEKCYARPLAKSKDDLRNIYIERYDLYCDCDYIVDANKSMDAIIESMVNFLGVNCQQ